ncbi:unnamed protein product [Porites lobata]|uniref:Uncharacterized protein n=1 Tax=Porites lobata TaxID=104759 RepID=A0ABN8N9B3_9CNID|nr:unnamed protein product [Porites lobata]
MATSRGDLQSRCLSLLEEVKDLIEKHNSEQSGSENSSKIAQKNGFTKRRAAAKIFPSKGSFVNVKEKLESVYSKLKDGSSFELLRSNLALINTLAGGYSVAFLRDAVARHRPISGHSKWTWTRQWLKALSSLSSYVFRTAATNKIS